MPEEALSVDASVVDSIEVTVPAQMTISGNPTGDVVLAIGNANQAAHTVLAGPTSGSPAAPTVRQLAAADVSGLGTAAAENLLSTIVDNGSGSLHLANSGVTAGTYTTMSSITISADGRITAFTA